jgi:hypothetical protein
MSHVLRIAAGVIVCLCAFYEILAIAVGHQSQSQSVQIMTLSCLIGWCLQAIARTPS